MPEKEPADAEPGIRDLRFAGVGPALGRTPCPSLVREADERNGARFT
jgi:hypothetical protein